MSSSRGDARRRQPRFGVQVTVTGPKAKPDRFSRGHNRKGATGHRRGLSASGKVVSKAQQRLFFARASLRPYAHQVARRGAAYRALPARKHAPTARSAR